MKGKRSSNRGECEDWVALLYVLWHIKQKRYLVAMRATRAQAHNHTKENNKHTSTNSYTYACARAPNRPIHTQHTSRSCASFLLRCGWYQAPIPTAWRTAKNEVIRINEDNAGWTQLQRRTLPRSEIIGLSEAEAGCLGDNEIRVDSCGFYAAPSNAVHRKHRNIGIDD